jgi:hypothetical protein
VKTFYTLIKYSPKPLSGFYELDLLEYYFEYLTDAEIERNKLESTLKKVDGRFSVEIMPIYIGTEDWDFVI